MDQPFTLDSTTPQMRLFEVWERPDHLLFVTSDTTAVRDHQERYPSDIVIECVWIRGETADA